MSTLRNILINVGREFGFVVRGAAGSRYGSGPLLPHPREKVRSSRIKNYHSKKHITCDMIFLWFDATFFLRYVRDSVSSSSIRSFLLRRPSDPRKVFELSACIRYIRTDTI